MQTAPNLSPKSPNASRPDPWPDWFRRTIELSEHCAARMVRLRATGMAAELTYRTLFALIPLTVLGLVLFQVVGGLDNIRSKVENQLFSFFGVPDIMYGEPAPFNELPSAEFNVLPVEQSSVEQSSQAQLSDPSAVAVAQLGTPRIGDKVDFAALNNHESAEPQAFPNQPLADVELRPIDKAPETPPTKEEARQLQLSIRNTLRDLTSKVTNLDFASLGVAGLLLFIYAAIGLTDSVEADFNLVCESKRHRPWHMRMVIHWAILTIGSGLLAMSLYASQLFIEWLAGHGGNTLVIKTFGALLGFVAGWVLLF